MTTTALPTTPAATRTTDRGVIAGRVATGLVVAFLVVDAVGKLFSAEPSVEGTTALGFAEHHVVLIGALLAVGVVLHVVPRTAFVGAVWLTAYLGGAVAAHVRQDDVGPVMFAAAFAVGLWAGYTLRDQRVRELAFGRG